MAFEGIRKRNGNPAKQKKKIPLREQLRLLKEAWRWNNIKATWKTERQRVGYNYESNMDKLRRKLE